VSGKRSDDANGVELPAPLADRRRHALRDLDELAEQVADGELDEATAESLRAGYEAELATVEQLAAGDTPAAPVEGRSPKRALVGASVLVGSLTVIILLAAQVFRSDDAPSSPAPTVAAALDGSIEEMEAVVAAHPESVGMRLALADRYFEQGEYGSAIDHYLQVTGGELTPDEESRTLGRIGWMAYSTGQVGSAVEFVNNSLEVNPDYHEGKLFLGMISLYGLEDAAAAIPLFEEVLGLPGLGEQIKAEVEAALAEARASVDSP
jgi:tetratricopeptide (TPR) repeat protein